jgi:hypothetical protein
MGRSGVMLELSHRTMPKAIADALCYGVGWQGQSVASIISQQVLSEIREIARSRLGLPKRRAEAANRIHQFKADLAAAPIEQAMRDRLQEILRRTLQRGGMQHDLTAEENSAYAQALNVLMGQIVPLIVQRKAPPVPR